MTDQRFEFEEQLEPRTRRRDESGFRAVVWWVFFGVAIAIGVLSMLLSVARFMAEQQPVPFNGVEILVVLLMIAYALGELSK